MITVLHVGQSEKHVIEVFLSHWNGATAITVDGQEILRTRPFSTLFKWKVRQTFEVGHSEKTTVEIVYSNPFMSPGKVYVNGRLHNGCLFPQEIAYVAIALWFISIGLIANLGLIVMFTLRISDYNLGVAAFDKGDYELAIEQLSASMRHDPKGYEYNKRGTAYRKKGEYDLAIADFTEAIRLDPKSQSAHASRGNAHFDNKDYDKALEDYRQASQLDPTEPHEFWGWGVRQYRNDYIGIAWLLATCPDDKVRDGKSAVVYATKACDVSDWKDPHCLNALAAAHAEAGNFKEAIKWQTKALSGLSKEDQEKGRSRLKLYEEGKPYRDARPFRF